MEDNKKSNTQRVAKAKFRQATNPEPIEKETKGRINWGLDNLYPQELVGYRQDNPIHGGIIEQKVTYMSSAGADILNLDTIKEELERILPLVVDDFETFNGFSILFKKVGEKWLLSHVDFEAVRYLAKEGWFVISDDWSNSSQSLEKTNYREIKDLAKANLLGEDPDKELLLYCKVKPKQRKLKNKKLSLCYYPIPPYVGAIVSILAGIEQDYFTFSEAVNGYKGGTLLSMNNGQPETDDKADEIADRIKEDATDRDKQGGLTIVFADGGDNAPTVQSLNGNDLDKRYIESNKEIRSKILIGHTAGSPTLFAVNSETMFGSKEEMEVAYTLFVNNYVNKRQKFISSGIEWACRKLHISENPSIQFRKYQLDLGGQTTSETKTQNEKMSAKDPIIQMMKKIGVGRKGLNILKTRTFDFQSTDEDFIASVQNFQDLTKNQQLILKLIEDGKSFNEISKALGKGALALSLEIVKLNARGLLNGWKVVDPSVINLEVLYSYEVKSGLGPAVIEGTRDFCRQLIELDRLYTRAEIDRLSNEMDTDVWRYRGGWYTNPDTGRSTPSCRHEWKQNIVKR